MTSRRGCPSRERSTDWQFPAVPPLPANDAVAGSQVRPTPVQTSSQLCPALPRNQQKPPTIAVQGGGGVMVGVGEGCGVGVGGGGELEPQATRPASTTVAPMVNAFIARSSRGSCKPLVPYTPSPDTWDHAGKSISRLLKNAEISDASGCQQGSPHPA